MIRKKKILVVDDDESIHLAIKYVLKHSEQKYDICSAYNGDEALSIIKNHNIHLVLMDIHMRTHEEGLEYLPRMKELDPDLAIVISSANTELDLATRVMKAGADSYLVKDYSSEQLLITIESVLTQRALIEENSHHQNDRKRLLAKNQLIGSSKQITKLMQDIEKLKKSKVNVVIYAETGCGKELVAKHIGLLGGKPFVAIDSSTIMGSMAESILFGHEKGAFTNAIAQTKGLFEEANEGAVYFDEISNMPLDIQSKLLRVVQEKEIVRIGANKSIPLDFRVICATNKDLEKLVSEGKFKDDLLQRLNVVSLRIPPLRERIIDLKELSAHFFSIHKMESSPIDFSDDAYAVLSKYNWPGNVRELSNLIANLCTMVVGQEYVEYEDLPEKIKILDLNRTSFVPASTVSKFLQNSEMISADQVDFYSYMNRCEELYLKKAFQQVQGSIPKLTKMIKMSRSHLYAKLALHGISKDGFGSEKSE